MAESLNLVVMQGSHTFLLTQFKDTTYDELIQAVKNEISKDLKPGEKISHLKLRNDNNEFIDLNPADIKSVKDCSKLQVVLKVTIHRSSGSGIVC